MESIVVLSLSHARCVTYDTQCDVTAAGEREREREETPAKARICVDGSDRIIIRIANMRIFQIVKMWVELGIMNIHVSIK
jgi:hypothetical protein